MFPSEIVTFRLRDGRERHVLCKRASRQNHDDHGHRGGIAYEAGVYRELLRRLPVSAPRFFGTYVDSATGETWLFIEYLEKAVGIEEAPVPATALGLAARWIGGFHALAEVRVLHPSTRSLHTYDDEYYLRWVRRTSLLAGDWHRRLGWLAALCERMEGFVRVLSAWPTTVIHGEYVPHNVLVRSDNVYPIDWESAAIAFGEIDLASLVDKWPPEVERACEREYQRARWPGGEPSDFARRLDTARLYWDFRWLGDRPEWTASEKVGARFEHLRATAERLGLVEKPGTK